MADEKISIVPIKNSIDFATIIGLLGAFGLVFTAIYLGGSVGSFINIPSILIVLLGTMAVTVICFSFKDFFITFKVVRKTLFANLREPSDAALQILQISQLARQKGVLALQEVLDKLSSEPFLLKGISLVVDGLPANEVESILRQETDSMILRHEKSVSVLKKAAEYAPAMGLIGTLIGLVQMLGNLEDPSTIGPSMAVALLTTFYGALLANMVFNPLATKLERSSSIEDMLNEIYLLGIVSVGKQENPRRLEMLLNSSLPPKNRVNFFE
ncbi:MAG: MotA/TolQ/ExbB proton channel family protein [Rhodospirillales bacterium]|nr:MotA/TolQ/ExbB proton channel family protein [Rhodospirillales bacterium]